jgi:hypothetical protein
MRRLALLTIALAAGLVLAAPAQAATWQTVDRHTDTSNWLTFASLSGGDEYDEPSVLGVRLRITAPRGRVGYHVNQHCYGDQRSESRTGPWHYYRTKRRSTRVIALAPRLLADASCTWYVGVEAHRGTLRAALEVLS